MNRRTITTFAILAALGLLFGAASRGTAQVASMQYDGRQTIALGDGTTVTVLHALGSTPAKPQYYYLPANLRIAAGPDGTPQFLFLKFTTEKTEAAGGINGGLLHFLMEFGLTDQQQQQVLAKLRQKEPQAELLGAAPVTPDGESGTFQITSATLSDMTLTKSLVTSGKAPLLPGQRVAAAARLTGNGAQLLAASLEKARSITDVSLSCNLAYHTLVPGVKASMKFNAEKFRQQRERLTVRYKDEKKGILWGRHEYTYSEARRMYDFLRENQIIEANIETRVDNEVATKIMEAFLQMFVNSLAQKQEVSPEEALKDTSQSEPADRDPKAPAVKGAKYTLNRYRFHEERQIKDMNWSFTAGVPIRETVQLTGNLGTWYNAVRNNPKCVAAVNLNDPFFTHRDVKLILDLDAKEIFDETVNYVTVNVRKRRSSGRPFEDSVTMDAKFVRENGLTASVTYARGEDRDPNVYEYQAQWSLKGGVLYPKDPPWQKGAWEGVTLSPPVRPRTIEVQCDPEELKEKGITRCIAQVRYAQFGGETEANVPLTPAKNETIVSRKLFFDPQRPAYSYRIVFYHKTQGRIEGPWVRDASDDYIYVSVPAGVGGA